MSNASPHPVCATSSNLCSAFQNASHDVWSRMADASRLGLRYGEETVTDSVLLDLMLKCPNEIHCESYTKWREAENGADWEFWFVSGWRGIGCRIQAKRLYEDGSYRALTLRSRSGQPTQAETLITAAAKDGRVPLHVFFTFPAKSMTKQPSSLSGCLVAHSSKIARLWRNRFEDIARISAPWHELVCVCPTVGNRLARIRDNLQAVCPTELEQVEVTTLPNYVQYAAWMLAQRRVGERREWRDGPQPRPMPEALVRGVVVVRVGEE